MNRVYGAWKNSKGRMTGYNPLKGDIRGLCIRCRKPLTHNPAANYCRACQRIVIDEDLKNCQKRQNINDKIKRIFKTEQYNPMKNLRTCLDCGIILIKGTQRNFCRKCQKKREIKRISENNFLYNQNKGIQKIIREERQRRIDNIFNEFIKSIKK